MANARQAAGSVFSTISDTANAVSGIVNTISGGLNMANTFVRHQSTKQALDYEYDLNDYEERLIERLGTEEAERKKRISELCKDPEMEEYYNAAYARLKAVRNKAA